MKNTMTFLRDNFTKYAVYLFLVLILLLARIYSPTYLQLSHMMGIFRLASFMGMAAIAQTLVIISGGIDLSIPYTISFAYILAAQYMNKVDANIPKAFLICMLLALIVGVCNGAGVCLLKIPPFIMTLGVGTVTRGAYMIFTKGTPKGYTAPLIATISNTSLGPIPRIVIVWAIMAVFIIVLLRYTPYGRKVYAVGSNVTASQFSGINTKRILFSVYIISAVVACITGFFLIGYTGESYLDAGLSYDTDVIAAVIIGGTSINGGKGGYLGSIAGALIMVVFSDFLQIVNISEGLRQVGSGVLVLLLVMFYAREREVRL
ncbi:MAG: ABC transporter permease [Lachnospiraceae bacterium]|nr:ABC transporter permease [Lachnospiraceae bacterium]